jgi:hypothetical protein
MNPLTSVLTANSINSNISMYTIYIAVFDPPQSGKRLADENTNQLQSFYVNIFLLNVFKSVKYYCLLYAHIVRLNCLG